MHNWRLLILLIPSLLQPILSEHSLIDGRQCCIHSSERRFLDENNRFAKPTVSPVDSQRLVDRRPTDQSVTQRYRYDVRDVEPTPFSREQHLKRDIFASDDRNRIVNVRRQRTIKDTSRDVRMQISREQNYKNSMPKNFRNTATSLNARLPREDKERENREYARYWLDNRSETHRSHLRQQDSGRTVISNTVHKNDVTTHNFRHEQTLPRQNHYNLNEQSDIVRERDFLGSYLTVPEEPTADSFKRNIRKRNLSRNSIRDNVGTRKSTDLRRERVNIKSNGLNIQQDISRLRNMFRSQDRVNSCIRNNLNNVKNNERYSKDNVREYGLVSKEVGIRQSNIRDTRDRHITRSQDGVYNPFEDDRRQNEGKKITDRNTSIKGARNVIRDNVSNGDYIQEKTVTADDNIRHQRERKTADRYMRPSHKKSNAILHERTDKTNIVRKLRDIVRERTLSAERHVTRTGARRIMDENVIQNRVERNTNVRNEPAYFDNDKTYLRDNILKRSVSVDRHVPQSDLKTVAAIRGIQNREEVKQHRFDTRKINTRNVKSHERYTNTKYECTDIRIAERFARDNIRERTLDQDIRQYDVRRITDRPRSREEPKTNIKYERTDARNTEQYSRENSRDRSLSVNREVRKLDVEMISELSLARSRTDQKSNEHSRNNEKNSRKDIRERSLSNERGIRKSEVKEVSAIQSTLRDERIDIRNDERYQRCHSSERVISSSRDGRQAETRRVSDGHGRRRMERNIIGQYERIGLRNRERDTNRQRDAPAERDVRQQGERRSRNIHIAYTRQEQNTIVRAEGTDIRNMGRYSRQNMYENTLSVERTVRPFNDRKIMRSNTFRNHEEHERNVRSDIRKVERYLNERTIYDERVTRKLDERRFTYDYDTVNRKEHNTVRDEREDNRNAGRYAKDNTHERTMYFNRDVRQYDTERITDKYLTRSRQERNTNVNRDRTNIKNTERYSRDNTRDRTASVNREIRESDATRLIDVQNYRNREDRIMDVRNKRSDIRNDERYSRDATRERIILMKRSENGRPQITMRIENRQVRNSDTSAKYSRFTHIHRTSEQTRERDFARSSNSRISESRTTALRSSTSDLYPEREADIRKGSRTSQHDMNMQRDYESRQNSELTNAFRTMVHNKAFDLTTEPTDNQFNALFYWQYLFYAIQGIYILGLLVQVFKDKEDKISAMGWVNHSRLIKVD